MVLQSSFGLALRTYATALGSQILSFHYIQWVPKSHGESPPGKAQALQWASQAFAIADLKNSVLGLLVDTEFCFWWRRAHLIPVPVFSPILPSAAWFHPCLHPPQYFLPQVGPSHVSNAGQAPVAPLLWMPQAYHTAFLQQPVPTSVLSAASLQSFRTGMGAGLAAVSAAESDLFWTQVHVDLYQLHSWGRPE